MAELAEQVDEGRRGGLEAVLGDALVREAIGLAAALVIVVLIDPVLRDGLRRLAGQLFRKRPDARKAREDAEVADFRRSVSEFEKSGGCGCA